MLSKIYALPFVLLLSLTYAHKRNIRCGKVKRSIYLARAPGTASLQVNQNFILYDVIKQILKYIIKG